MKRKCHCSGGCGPQGDGWSRREFIGVVGAGAAGALWSPPLRAAALGPEDLARWQSELLTATPPRLYRSETHSDARLHLGGIGTGNFEIGADGQLTTWQLFNTLREGDVPFHFALKTGAVVRLLQTRGGPGDARVKRIEMTGEYPLARLRFADPDLPVGLELTAFSPFAPLETRLSSIPLAAFVFRVSNPTAGEQTVSLAAFLLNPVGYDAAGKIEGAAHPNFGGNRIAAFAEGELQGLEFRADPGRAPTLDRPVRLYVSANLEGLNAPPADRPAELSLASLSQLPPAASELREPGHTILWLEDAPTDLAASVLERARAAVLAGATLVFAGGTMPLLAAYGSASGGRPLAQAVGRPDIVFEDFEGGYEKWTVEGRAFGSKPAAGTLPNQQPVHGFLGHGLVNSFLEGDGTTGRLTSRSFTIERQFIRFLVGGGRHRDTQIRLVVGGKVVRATSGSDNEQLRPASWDVREFQGRTAQLQIVDNNQGGWGHINVDQIEFSDAPADRATFALLEELLPARFSAVRPAGEPSGRQPRTVILADVQPRDGVQDRTSADGLRFLSRPLGGGRVVLVAGALLDPAAAALSGARQRAYALVCGLAGATYTAPTSPLATAPGFGTLALATLADLRTETPSNNATPGAPPPLAVPAAQITAHGRLAEMAEAWRSFQADGRFLPLAQVGTTQPTPPGTTAVGALASTVRVPAGATVEIPFLLAWHYPNKYNGAGVAMGCHYTTRWPDARAVVKEARQRFLDWRRTTERFQATFYSSTLPYWLLDCLTSQAGTIRHIGVVFRIANADVYGWEGSNGCCEPTCTHVWGYEQSLARLFPDLEKDMRRIDFEHQQRPDGGINNRTDLPSPPHPSGEQPFTDGHASCILKAWREALNHPDDSWLRAYWPKVRKAVEYLIARDAATGGGRPTGVLNDDQWNTYDEALHGVTTFIGSYYLAALRAGEAWARRVEEPATADHFHEVFDRGRKRLIDLCWNGEYFQQHLPDYQQRSGEVGPGCMADQLIGQWWAHQLGLGYLLPQEMVRSALRAVFKYNWKPDLTGWHHSPRAFAGARDKGLIICTWPRGGRPGNVMLYSDEVWTGIEYQVAAHLIYEGMLTEGLAIVKGARDRYDGVPRPPIPRNPWNEIECGGHYARAMSSWSLLLALSGYEYDGPRQVLRFTPRISPEKFQSFFCGPLGWGHLRQTRADGRQVNEISVVHGRLGVGRLRLAMVAAPKGAAVTWVRDGVEQRVAATLEPGGNEATVALAQPVALEAGQRLVVRLT